MNHISNNLAKYYVKNIVENLSNNFNNSQIADLMNISLSTIKNVKKDEVASASNKIDDLIGEVEEEYLRELAVYQCLSLFSSRGWQVGTTDSKCVYDIFCEKNGRVVKIQVRSGSKLSKRGFPRFKTGRILFNTTRVERTCFKKGDFDFWYFYHKNGDSWLVPFDDLNSTAEVTMEKYYDYIVNRE